MGVAEMRVLVLCDDFWHPAHVPRAGLAPLADRGVVFDWLEDASEWSAERMADYPVVILTKGNDTTAADRTPWMIPAVEEAFRAYVEAGGGLLAIHSGTIGYRETPVLRALLGAQRGKRLLLTRHAVLDVAQLAIPTKHP